MAGFTYRSGSQTVLFTPRGVVYKLFGGVHIEADGYTIKGKTALYYESSGLAYVYKALVRSANLRMKADTLVYNSRTRYLRLSGKAEFEDNHRLVRGGSIVSKNDSAWVRRGVFLRSKNRGVFVIGDSAFYDANTAFGWVLGDPRGGIPRGKDTLWIEADEFYLHKDTTIALGNCKMVSEAGEAFGDTAWALIPDGKLKVVFIKGNSRLNWEEGFGTSHELRILFEGEDVRYVDFLDSAYVKHQNVELSGEYIRVEFKEGRIERLMVRSLTKGVYR